MLPDLPVELAEDILTYVGGIGTWRARAVCRQWRVLIDTQLSDAFWKRLCAIEFPSSLSSPHHPSHFDAAQDDARRWGVGGWWREEYQRVASARVFLKCSLCHLPIRKLNAIRPHHRDPRAIVCSLCLTHPSHPSLLSAAKCVKDYKPIQKEHLEVFYHTLYRSEAMAAMVRGPRSGKYYFVWDVVCLQQCLLKDSKNQPNPKKRKRNEKK